MSCARSSGLGFASVAPESEYPVHAELERVLKLELDPATVMLGINNRDLQTFKVDLQNNQRIMDSGAGKEVRLAHELEQTTLAAHSTS